MAKTTSQIIAENKIKRAEAAAIAASRDKIHQQQMAGVAEESAAKTLAVLNKAISGTTDSTKKSELSRAAQMVKEEYTKYSSQQKSGAKTATDMQKKKENRIEEKHQADSLRIKKDQAQKALDDFDNNKEIDWTDTNQRKAYDAERKRLQDEVDRAGAEIDKRENARIRENDMAEIESWSDEDREQLRRYISSDSNTGNILVNSNPILWFKENKALGDSAKYLYGKYGEEKTKQLASSYSRYLNEAEAEKIKEETQNAVNKSTASAIGQNILGIGTRLFGGLQATVDRFGEALDRDKRYSTLVPVNSGDLMSIHGNTVTAQTAQNIAGEDGGILRQGASYLYQGGMTMVDSFARAAAGGGAFGGAALAAIGSFSQTMAEASRNGATPAQAALLATTTAGIEALSEKIPLDNLIRTAKGKGAKTVIANALRQMGIEATTEEISLLGTVLAEAAILQEKSSYRRDVMTAIMNGMSPDDAVLQASQNIVDEAMNTALVSMISGGVSSLGGSYADARGLFAETQEQTNPELNRPKNVQQTTQEAIANNQARRERQAAEEATQQPQAAPVQQEAAQPDMQQEAPQQVQAVQQPQEAQQAQQQTTQPQTQQSLDEIFADMFTQLQDKPQDKGGMRDRSGYYDEFENWGVDPNREGVENPMADRKYSEVGKRDVKAYMYENPAVKPFYQEQAAWMLSELSDSTRGERTYNEQLHYDSGGEQGWSGTKRHTSDSIAELLDQDGMTYEQIEKGLNAIIHDNGQENNAISKRIEFVINDRLMNGYTDFYTGQRVQGNAEYLNLLRNQQSAPTADMQMGATNQSTEGGQIKGTGAAEANFSGKAAYQDLLYEGNVQRDRPGDVRPVEVPKTDTQGRKVSETVGNFYGAAVTSDEMANRIEELVQDGALSYDTRTNKQSLENASSEITKRGEESVRAAIAKNVGQNKIQDGDVEKALLLYAKDANDPNRQEAAAEMMVQLQEMATMSGRNLQLFRLVRRMTPEGQLMAIQKEVRANTEKMIKSGSVKKGFEPVANTELEKEYMKAAKDAKSAKSDQARQEAEQSMQELQNAMYLDAAAQMPATFKAKWDAWRYMAMLGNVKTQVRNLAGNLAFKPYKEVKDKMGALAEKLFVPKDQRTKSLVTDKALAKWAREDAKNQSVSDALKYSAKLGDDVSTQKIRENMQVFNSKALDNVRKFVESVPQSGDMLFKNNYYSRSLAGFLKARGYTAADVQNNLVNPEVMSEARSYAIQEAMKATFNDSNAFSDFMATDLRYKGDNPMGKALNMVAEGVLPFRRTPANIAVRFSEYSPVGFAKGLWDAATKVKNGNMTAATAIDEMTSGLTGSAAMVLGIALAGGLFGIKITGSGTDEDEKRQGHQDYALEFSVDGQEYSYKIDWAAPANLPLFVGANIYSALENAGEDTDVSKFTSFARGMGTAFEPMLALSCMSSLNDLVEGVRYAEEGEALYTIAAKAATGYFTQGIPALARQTTQAFTENKQTTFTTSDDPTIRDLQSTAAGLGVGNPYKTDKVNAWGEVESAGTPLERIVNAFLNPGTLKKIDNSEVEQEISRLNAAGQNVTPDKFAKTVSYTDKDGNGHDEVRLTEEQYQTLAQTQGQTERKLLEDMFKSASYKGMDDTQKAEAIKTVYQYARMTGEIAAIDDHTGYDQSWMYDVEKGGANEILRRELNSGINTAMGDLDNAWDKGYNEERFVQEMENMFRSYQNAPAAMKKQVYAEASGTAKKYIEVRDKGISHTDALSAIKNVATVKGTGSINKETGKPTVRDIDRRQAIANTTGLSEKEIDILMKAYMADYDPNDESPETTEFKYQYAREELGLSPKEYADTYRAYLDNSRKNQKIKAIRALGYDYKTANALYKLYYGRMKNDLIEMYG